MRRLNDGAGVAPAPLWYAHRRSGSPWVPVRSYYEGLPSMAGRGPDEGEAKAPPDQRGVTLPCPDPEDGPGVEDAISGAPGGERASQGTRAPSTRCPTKT